MTPEQFIQNCVDDSEVKIMQLLMENFRQQSFYGEAWPAAKSPKKGGQKLLYKSNDLQGGFMSSNNGADIKVTNSTDYADIHNSGGDIPVTMKMKKFFWAMHYKASGGKSKTAKGNAANTKQNRALSAEAEYWKNMALMKVGSIIRIPKRQFLGAHARQDEAIKRIVDRNVQELADAIGASLQP